MGTIALKMRIGYILLALFFFSLSTSFSQNHNTIEVDLERVKKDIIDLQKFVYQNSNLDLSEQNTSPLEIENLITEMIMKEKLRFLRKLPASSMVTDMVFL